MKETLSGTKRLSGSRRLSQDQGDYPKIRETLPITRGLSQDQGSKETLSESRTCFSGSRIFSKDLVLGSKNVPCDEVVQPG